MVSENTTSPKLAAAAVAKEVRSPDPKSKKLLSPEMLAKVMALFKGLDENGDGTVTLEEAQRYWKKGFAKINAAAMFNEVDEDGDGSVTEVEWVGFWENVMAQPDYTEEEVLEELDGILEGGSWVDFNDGRTT